MSISELPDDVMGKRVGAMLRERADRTPAPSIAIGEVRHGAQRRQRRSRAGVAALCVLLVGGAGYAVSRRAPQSQPAEQPSPAPAEVVMDRYALMDGATALAAWAQVGGVPYGVALPEIDVWAAQQQRLVVRTFVEPGSTPETNATVDVPTTAAAAPTTGPWADRPVDRVQVRGVLGAIEELSPDQFSVWVPTTVDGRYTQVISRGFTREETLATVESLVEVDGVLQPPDQFVLSEHADAAPATTPAGPFAQVSYGPQEGASEQGNSWLATFEPTPGRASLELALWSSTGRVETIGGRTVLLTDEYGHSSASWVDDSGLLVTVWRDLPEVEELVPSVQMASQGEFLRLAGSISERLRTGTRATGSASFDAGTVTRRTGGGATALCVAAGIREVCVAEQGTEEVENATMHTSVDGHWFIFGHREIGDDERSTLHPDQLAFTTPDGSPCTVEIEEHDGAYWYLVAVPDGVNIVTTNVGEIFGGIVGDISRPLGASTF